MPRTVLITGGGGFLGQQIAARLSADHSVVLGRRNSDLSQAGQRMKGCRTIGIDVTNTESVRTAFYEVRPSIVIHAAGTKFIERAEQFPSECVDINVLGSENVAKAAVESGVDVVVGLSTVHAAPPVRNTYGLSKALMERMFCAFDAQATTRFVCLRYGNVAWSTGSVLAVWRQMFADTKVIQTTGPDMRRFFLSADDAVNLLVLALSHIEQVRGSVLSQAMKVAQISDILDIWTGKFGGRWVKIAERRHEGVDEYLIGELELPYAEQWTVGDREYYLISFNRFSAQPLAAVVSSATGARFSREEIACILATPPTV